MRPSSPAPKSDSATATTTGGRNAATTVKCDPVILNQARRKLSLRDDGANTPMKKVVEQCLLLGIGAVEAGVPMDTLLDTPLALARFGLAPNPEGRQTPTAA